MDDTALVRRHRTKLHAATLACSLACGRAGERLELLTLAVLVAFHVDDDREAETDLTHGDGGNQKLQGIKRATMTANQNCQVITGDIKDELALVAFILVDGDFTDVEILEHVLQNGNGGVGNFIELLIS